MFSLQENCRAMPCIRVYRSKKLFGSCVSFYLYW